MSLAFNSYRFRNNFLKFMIDFNIQFLQKENSLNFPTKIIKSQNDKGIFLSYTLISSSFKKNL